MRYARAWVAILAFILSLSVLAPAASAQPSDLIRRVAARETENEAERNNYTYRQTVTVEDLDDHGARLGEYREVRDIVFSPTMERSEQVIEKPRNTLKRLKMTDEDFRDIREIQPILITKDSLFLYETKFKGEELIDGLDSWVIQVKPRQLLHGQRLFDGIIWVDKSDFAIVRLEGQAVPQIRTTKEGNLFPHFTTIREKLDGKFWFAVKTYGDDTLYFRSGPQRIRMIIRYANYKRFGAETKIEFK